MIEKEGKINVAVIGCGYWGPNLIRNFHQIEPANLYSICDLDEKKLNSIKKAYPHIKTTTNHLELLSDPEIDAVVIALPVFKHYELAKEALLNNKHVLIEKPITSSSEQAKELIKIAQEKNKILMVDHTFEYSPAINKIKEIISSGELGKIYYIRAEWLNLGLLQPDVNVSWDLATHIISIINYLIDLKPTTITAEASGCLRREIPEFANINIKFPNNISAYLSVGWLEPEKTRRMTIIGNKKMLVFDLMDKDHQIKIYNKSANLVSENERFKVEYKDEGFAFPEIEDTEPLSNMAKHFIDCIINNKKPRSDGESGLAVVEILESIDKSINSLKSLD